MSNDKMRAEFEAWAKANYLPTATCHFGATWSYVDLRTAWAHQGYAAGQKAAESDLKNAIEDIIGETAFEGLPESKQESLLRLIGQDYKPEGER